MNQGNSDTVSVTRDYYNDQSADRFYDTIWGGEDIHIGFYESEGESIFDASRRTVEKMTALLPSVSQETKIVDLGAGYGGSARYLVKRFGCSVTCLNLSEVQNRKNREQNKAAGLDNLIDVIDGSFEDLPFSACSYEIAWSQDSILHSGNRAKVLDEVDRVLKPGGYFVFTDPMQSDDCSPEALKPVYERIRLSSMGSPGFYRSEARRLGWTELQWVDLSHQLVNHYSRVRQEIIRREEELRKACERDYIERMKSGLQHWVDNGKQGNLKWGIFLFRKS